MRSKQVLNDINNPKIIAREKWLADRLADRWDCNLAKMPISMKLDWVLTKKNTIRAFVEGKCRNFKSDQYSTLLINLDKWMNGIWLYETTSIPFILAVGFTDDRVLYYHYSPEDKVSFILGGRTKKTRDWEDIAPVVHIPIKLFKSL